MTPLAMKNQLTNAEIMDMAEHYSFLKRIFIEPSGEAMTALYNENLDLKETVFNLKETIRSLEKALNESTNNRC